MQVTIFGASGKVGRLAVVEALARGHHVVGFVHSPVKFEPGSRLSLFRGDIHKPDDVSASLKGSQAVISALGSWGSSSKAKDILAAGMRCIIPAMEAQAITRIISLTGTEAYDSTDRPDLLRKLAHSAADIAAHKILYDGEEHIRLLRGSSLDWTVLRSPVMTNGSAIFYRLSLMPMAPWQTIPRRAVAKALVDQLEGPGYSKAAPFIYRR